MKPFVILFAVMVLASSACLGSTPSAAPTQAQPTSAPPTATAEFAEVTLTILNNSGVDLQYLWVNFEGQEENYGTLPAGASLEQSTYSDQVWRLRDEAGNLILEYTVTQAARQTMTVEADAVAAADPVADRLLEQLDKFKEDGRIPATEGEYIRLEDFSESFAQLGYYQGYPTGIELENFVFIGHLSWETALATSDVSACGILFASQPDSSDYAVFLDKSRVYFSSSTATSYKELGKTSGTGRVNFTNPAEADFSLVVYENHAYVYVNDDFIGEYTLSADKPLRGGFGYGIISGTNRDYGTRCEITEAGVWSLE
jgi:hypothetical protein